MDAKDLITYFGESYVIGPLVAMAAVALTVVACELRRAGPGRWQWRSVAAWTVPAATTGIMLTAVVVVGLDGADEVASILSLFVAVMANFGQWLVIIRSAAKPAGS
jgi:energy-converting hydrogenase Eha subunit A